MYKKGLKKNIYLFLISILSSIYPAKANSDFKSGDCFRYEEFSNKNKFEWVIGKIDMLNLRTFDYTGKLYAKVKNKKEYIQYNFELPYSKKEKYKKTKCPKLLPLK